MTTATKAKKSAKTQTETTPLTLQGMGDVEIGNVQYINIDDAIKTFNYLWQFDKSFYVRTKSKLTQEEIKIYQTILTVPKGIDSFYIRNLTPFLVWKAPNGKHYLINGNSRLQTMTDIRKKDKTIEFCDVSFQVIEGELTKYQIERLQYDMNDTTRRNPSIETYRRIVAKIKELTDSGIELPRAREHVTAYFGKSQQTISNAIKLCAEPIPPLLEDLLDSDNATTEGCVKCIQAATALKLSPETVAGLVLAHAKKAKLTENNVKKWRQDYEEEQTRLAEEARLKAEQEAAEKEAVKEIQEQRSQKDALQSIIGEDTVTDEIKDFDDENPTVKEETQKEEQLQTPQLDINSVIEATNPDKLGIMFRIAAALLTNQELSDEAKIAAHESIKGLLMTLSTGLSESKKAKIQNALM